AVPVLCQPSSASACQFIPLALLVISYLSRTLSGRAMAVTGVWLGPAGSAGALAAAARAVAWAGSLAVAAGASALPAPGWGAVAIKSVATCALSSWATASFSLRDGLLAGLSALVAGFAGALTGGAAMGAGGLSMLRVTKARACGEAGLDSGPNRFGRVPSSSAWAVTTSTASSASTRQGGARRLFMRPKSPDRWKAAGPRRPAAGPPHHPRPGQRWPANQAPPCPAPGGHR